MSRTGPLAPALSVLSKKNVTLSGLEATNTAKTNTLETVKADVKVSAGRWYYEVKLQSNGLLQIGWCTDQCNPQSEKSEGVGNDAHSWSYDGSRQKKWHATGTTYGESWSTGDVIGCALDLSAGSMSFYRNGTDLGVAFTGLAKVALAPAVSLARNQRALFNFGASKFVNNLPGYQPIHSFLTEQQRAELEKMFYKYQAIGRALNASTDPDGPIKPQGTLQLGEDLGITDVTDPRLLVIAFSLGSKVQWEFTPDEFIGGLAKHNVYNLQTLDARSKKWTEDLFRKPPPADFRQFYNFTFDYLKEDKKILLTEEALMVWKMLFTGRWPLLEKWLAFVTSSNMKSVSRDTWQQLYEFMEQNAKDVSSYDPYSSWPVAIDEFVEWLRKNV
jgi:hypothetical protein